MIGGMKRHCQISGWAGLAALCIAFPADGAGYTLEAGTGVLRHEGYLQTPAGGMPGSASLERPTFAEIDLGDGSYRWLAGSVTFHGKDQAEGPSVFGYPFHVRLRVRYVAIGDASATRLATGLTIRAGTFPAGDSVRSRASFDGLSLGLAGVLELGGGVSAELGARVGWTAFEFAMVGDDHQAHRAYHVNTVGLAAGIGKDFGNGWHIGAVLGAAPGFEGTGSHYLVEPRVSRRLGRHATIALGARFEEFRYDDAHKQALPNQLRVKRRAVPTLALGLRF